MNTNTAAGRRSVAIARTAPSHIAGLPFWIVLAKPFPAIVQNANTGKPRSMDEVDQDRDDDS